MFKQGVLDTTLRAIKRLIPEPLFRLGAKIYHPLLSWSGALVYRFPSRKLKVIGVTGTKGKSTVVILTAKLLEGAGHPVAAIGSLGYKIRDREWPNLLKMTMPGRWKLQKFLREAVTAGCTHVIMEVPSEGLTQGRHLGVHFDCAVFTGLHPEHIEEHGVAEDTALDRKVRAFLEENRWAWRDMNVPSEDGQILHDLVVKHRFRRALEIGTSTGHSSIWIAWELSKTGGRLTTLEIDPRRHAQAKRNFEESGVAGPVDARLGDAHELVKELPGPLDFVFSDADKHWYLQYFKDLDPKLEVGGCFTAHNVRRSGGGGAYEFLEHVKKLPNYRTTVEIGGGEGISVSCKTSQQP